MNILITGAAGLLGSTLILNIPNKHHITAFDNNRENLNKLKELTKNKNIECIEGDITNKSVVEGVMKGIGTVIHLASIVGDERCNKDPGKSMLVNVYGTHLLVEAAKKYKIKKFIFASTYWVYGTFMEHKALLKEDQLTEPDTLYASTKAISEYEIKENLSYIILRFSNIYGFGSGINFLQGGVIAKFINNTFNEESLTIYGSGEQRVEYVHLQDVVNAITFFIENNVINETYNIGSGKSVSINEIAKIIEGFSKDFNKKAIVEKIPAPQDKIWPDKKTDITKIKSLMRSYPSLSIKEGIKKTMEDCHASLNKTIF